MRGREQSGRPDPETRTESEEPGLPGGGTSAGVLECAARGLAEDVIARLLQKSDLRQPQPVQSAPSEIDALCDALLSSEPGAGLAFVEDLHARGTGSDSLYLDYVAAAARCLGERWVDDRVSFVEVTLGLGRLHEILRVLGPALFSQRKAPSEGLTALLAPVPGESHVLGIVMAADFLRRNGWQVEVDLCGSLAELRDAAAAADYAMIGLSAGTRRMCDPLGAAVAEVRRASPSSVIVVGGHITELEPDIAEQCGADAVASDIVSDGLKLKRMVAQRVGAIDKAV